jgi:hypothetical protein
MNKVKNNNGDYVVAVGALGSKERAICMGVDARALKVLTDWNSREYTNEGQKAASLQVLIIEALKEQAEL